MLLVKQAQQGLYSGPAMFFQPPRPSPVDGFLPETGEVGYLAVMTCDGMEFFPSVDAFFCCISSFGSPFISKDKLACRSQ